MDRDLSRAEMDAKRIRIALSNPLYSHAVRREWCGQEQIHFFVEAFTPSGVFLLDTVPATAENLAMAGEVLRDPSR